MAFPLYYYFIGAFVIFLVAGIRIVNQYERGLTERFGKYNRFAIPGFNWIIPLIENIRQVDIRETMVDAEPQEIITLDKLNAVVDAQVYFKVKPDPQSVYNSQYNVYNYKYQIVSLARTTLRNIIGTMNLTDANSKRDKINQDLMVTLTKETGNWGIEVVRTELKEINPPKNVQDTMNEVVMAENKKTSAVDFATAKETTADGDKRGAIKKAEGEKQARILEAEGQAQAIKLKAEAEANAIKVVNEAAKLYFKDDAQKLKQLEVVQASLQNNAKIIITKDGINPVLLLGDLIK